MIEEHPAPHRGRPRDHEVDRRIREAAHALMAEEGYSAVTVSGVARRAGLPRSTVYRRHRSQFALRYETLMLPAGGPAPVHDSGDVDHDVRVHVAGNAAPFRDERTRALLRAISADLMVDEHGRTIVNREQVLPRLHEVAAMLGAARERGDLPARCDPMLAATAVTGTLIYHALVLDQPVDDDLVERLVRLLFAP